MTTDVKLLPLPRTLQHADDADLAAHVQDYARACVAHATAPLQAEIEALRAEAIEWRGLFDMAKARADKAEARAERLAEALRHLRNHTSVNSYQIELIDAALRDHDQEMSNG